jgi:hypothetical protein
MPNGDHAAAAGNFLTRKIGPLPAWAYGVAAAVVVGGVVVLYQRGKSTTTGATSQASSPYASSAQGQLNYPPTVVVTPGGIGNTVTPGAPPAPSAPSPTTGNHITIRPKSTAGPYAGYDAQAPGVPAYVDPATAQVAGSVPFEASLVAMGNPVSGKNNGFSSTYWPFQGPGGTLFVAANDVAGFGGAGGKGRPGTLVTRQISGMGRRWDHFQPFQPSQYVDGRGGDGMGGGLPAVAKKTGISHLRLRSLNPHLRRPDGSYGNGIIRIA